MMEPITNKDGIRRRGPFEPEKSHALLKRRNEPSLIKKAEWNKLLQLRHPAVYRGDRILFDHWLENYKLLLRSKHIDYPMIRDRLEYALKLERKSVKQLERIVTNDSLFAAISSQSVCHAVFSRHMRRALEKTLPVQLNLVSLYEGAIEWLGSERGAKGNHALSFLITSIDGIVRKRTGRSLSQSKKDVELVYVLANAVGGGPEKNTVKNKIAEMKKLRKKADALLSIE